MLARASCATPTPQRVHRQLLGQMYALVSAHTVPVCARKREYVYISYMCLCVFVHMGMCGGLGVASQHASVHVSLFALV